MMRSQLASALVFLLSLLWLVRYDALDWEQELLALALAPAWLVAGHLVSFLSFLVTCRSWRRSVAFLRSTLLAYSECRSLRHALTSSWTAAREEALLRGVLLVWLASLAGPWTAVMLTSLLFAACHLLEGNRRKGHPVQLVDYALVGLVLAGLVMASGALVPAVIVHGTRNYLLKCLMISRQEYEALVARRNAGLRSSSSPSSG
jgi:membrane protease YdiL (CAAX protease family)